MLISCPYLEADVELTARREEHIFQKHPDLSVEHRNKISEVLAEPDAVRLSSRASDTRLFSRWYDDIGTGKHVVVVVVSDTTPTKRHWVITAYLARRLPPGGVEWQRK